ncbi:hypothetical protein PILCRDRAFT_192953 [Piloderma croceum F 1598]|uniref:Uncharacterized protein n=1 Tax=Piloderma croceum (strain F 1598) TaxID=765440 RepID=A0A0C3GGC5_PILCF|nr:hypothetical protein PILCRDRAFT_192953 [Piloderma croceum F 1598]
MMSSCFAALFGTTLHLSGVALQISHLGGIMINYFTFSIVLPSYKYFPNGRRVPNMSRANSDSKWQYHHNNNINALLTRAHESTVALAMSSGTSFIVRQLINPTDSQLDGFARVLSIAFEKGVLFFCDVRSVI